MYIPVLHASVSILRNGLVQVMSVVGILADDVDPMVSVMKVEKAPTETYADIGGLHEQVCVWVIDE
jgi:ATP-dependent 26S proteasome regulatory subunit